MFESYKPTPDSTAICISVPEDMTPEQRRVLAQKLSKAAQEAGAHGASVLWSNVYDSGLGPPVFYQP